MKVTKCLVIGGNSGIGFECVKHLEKLNYQIIVAATFTSVNEAKLKLLFKNKSNILFYKIDITKDPEIEELSNFIAQKFGSLDILINSAGLGFYKKFETASMMEIEKIIDINLTAPIKLFNKLIPLMNKNSHPFVIQMGSYAGKDKGHRLFSVYSAAKTGLLGFFNSIVSEYSTSTIKFFLIYIPGTKTDFFSKAIGGKDFQKKAKTSKLFNPSKIVDEMFYKIGKPSSEKDHLIYL